MDIHITKYSQLAEFLLYLFLPILAVKPGTVGSTHLCVPYKLLIIQPTIKHIGTNLQFIVIVDIQVLIHHTVIRRFSVLSEQIDRRITHVIRTLCRSRQSRHRNQAKADMPSGYQSRIRLVSHIVGTEIKISEVTQQCTDTGAFFVQINHVELLTRTYIRHPASALHNPQSLGSEPLIVNRINEIRVLHIHRIDNARLQTVFLINNRFISYLPIEIAIITKQISSYLHTYLRVDRRNKYGRIGRKTVEHPFTESLLIFHEVIVHPHFKRDRKDTAKHLCTRCLIECSINFRQRRLSYRCCRFIQYDSLASGVKHLPFGKMFRHRTSRQ